MRIVHTALQINASAATLSIVGAVQKEKETRQCLEISNFPPTRYLKVKSNQPAGCKHLYSRQVIELVLLGWADVKGQEDF